VDVLYLLIPLTVVLLVIALIAFLWAVKTEQFEDLDREASRILFDEDEETDQASINQPPDPKNPGT
jgi:cbb3-type cytochrome oxidase maturation protein